MLVFTRTPVPGRVKTRLIPAIGAERAANLHQVMLWRTVATAAEANVGPLALWCTPASAHPVFEQLQRNFALELQVQSGADLGERMHRALEQALAHAHGALLVGIDCPFLQAQDLREAADALAAGADAVIGPAEDGGYYLIGVRRSDPAAFANIEWGSEGVLVATREKFHALGWQWRELTTRRDVDRPEDLTALGDRLIY